MKCILHIGTEKTGTTLIQEWLYHNKDALQKQGVGLSSVIAYPNNRKLVAYFQNHYDDFCRNHKITNEAEKAEFFKGLLDDFRNEVEGLKGKCDRFVITSEHFHSRLIDIDSIYRLKEFLSSIFDEIIVVCYFREQSAVRTSLYSTAIRGGFAGTIADFQRDVDDSNHYYNYYEMFSKWREVFGAEALRPTIFGKSNFVDGDIRVDLLKKINPDIAVETMDYTVEKANEKIPPLAAAVMSSVNAIVQTDASDMALRKIRNKVNRLASRMTDLQIGENIDPDNIAFYDRFYESNKLFFKEFFNQEDGCFNRPIQMKQSLIIEDMVGFVSTLTRELLTIAISERTTEAARRPPPKRPA
ncbi:hypothetical protein [Sphingobium ummariense]